LLGVAVQLDEGGRGQAVNPNYPGRSANPSEYSSGLVVATALSGVSIFDLDYPVT